MGLEHGQLSHHIFLTLSYLLRYLVTEVRNTYTILDKNPHSEALLRNKAYKSG